MIRRFDKPSSEALRAGCAFGEGAGDETHRAPRRRPRPALSMVELLAVITILSIVAALAAPRVAGFTTQQSLEAAARRIATDLDFARRNARNGSAARTVSFDPITNRYEMAGVSDPNRPAQDYTVDLSLDPYRAAIVSADFGGASAITFDGFGTPDSGGTVVVQVGSQQRTVTFDGP